ncbi:MAG: hypothetical protein HY423_04435, partial [Candidatus Lambdaproteobacteria bacterium]|nr:hypothetical protein [Candidatus Lambdaproteobacteria bacterium]
MNATDLLTGWRCDHTAGSPDGTSPQAELVLGPIKCPPGARITLGEIVRHPVDRQYGILVRYEATGIVAHYAAGVVRSIDPRMVRAIRHAAW